MNTDPIADYLTRIRNASSTGHKVVEIPTSKIKNEITKILFDEGYIMSYKIVEIKDNQDIIKIALKYVFEQPLSQKLFKACLKPS